MIHILLVINESSTSIGFIFPWALITGSSIIQWLKNYYSL